MTIQTLRKKLIEQKNRVGLVRGSVEVNEFDEAEHDISAYIDPQTWKITVNLKKGFEPVKDKRQKAYARAKGIADGLETLVMHVGGLHEPAHWELPIGSGRGCPYDLYNHDKIIEAIKSNLPEDKRAQVSYIANAFEDSVINPACREFNGDFSGQVLFWDNEGLRVQKSGQESFNQFYEAFVKLNMHLWGDKKDNALLKRHYTNAKPIDKALDGFVQELDLPKNIQDTSVLFDKNEWPKMAGAFARHFAPLIEDTPKERLSAFMSEDGESSQGSSGEEQKQPAGNGVEQKMGSREGNEQIAFGRYSNGESQSPNITSYDQLDSLYRMMARSIPVAIEAMTKQQSLPITPLNYRPFDAEKDDPRKIRTSKLFATDKGLAFGYQHKPLTITARSKVQKRSFPDFKMVVLDNSGSMKLNARNEENVGNTSFIPWGDKSKYHYALLGMYGIEAFLQNQGIAQYINHGMSLFSDTTRYKEGDFSHLADVRKLALSPQWGNTNLDAQVLKQALQGNESFVLSISDGEIGNWDEVKTEFEKIVAPHHYAHVQIGQETQFTRDLKSWGTPVFPVSSGDDLARLMVDVTKNTYRSYVKE